MKSDELFNRWAPATSIWTPWVKPAPFAMEKRLEEAVATFSSVPAITLERYAEIKLPWLPASTEQTAVMLDLPGKVSINMAVAAAMQGYRPVLSINTTSGSGELVDMLSVLQAIIAAAQVLPQIALPPAAPPVFILDAHRMSGMPVPRKYDNRWLALPQDFPSAAFLQTHGISKVLLVQGQGSNQTKDLEHILRRWQEAGLAILTHNPESNAPPLPCNVPKPSYFRSIFHRMQALVGLRRNSAGGFGSLIPEPSQSSGYG